MKHKTLLAAVILALAASVMTCDDTTVCPTMTEEPPFGTYIDEPILLAASDPVAPSETAADTFTFDMTAAGLVRDGTFNDFDITYVTQTANDVDVLVLNHEDGTWHILSSMQSRTVPGSDPVTQRHLFSARGLEAGKYISDGGTMQLRGAIDSPRVRALKMNTDYVAIPVHTVYPFGFTAMPGCLTSDGENLYVVSPSNTLVQPRAVYRVSPDGGITLQFDSPAADCYGMTYDGESFWFAGNNKRIFKTSTDGEPLCEFSYIDQLFEGAGGLGWGLDQLLVIENKAARDISHARIFGADADGSCDAGFALVTFTFETTGNNGAGIAWNGSRFLTAFHDSLFTFNTYGSLAGTYAFPVEGIGDITWDGESIWVLNTGPRGVESKDPVITRLRMR